MRNSRKDNCSVKFDVKIKGRATDKTITNITIDAPILNLN